MRTITNFIAFAVFCFLAVGSALTQEVTISYVELDCPTGSQFLQVYYGEEMSYPALSPEEYLNQAALLGGFENTEDAFRHQKPGVWKIPVGAKYANQAGVKTVTLMVTPDTVTQVLPSELTAMQSDISVAALELQPAPPDVKATDLIRRELALPDVNSLFAPSGLSEADITFERLELEQKIGGLKAALSASKAEIERQAAQAETLAAPTPALIPAPIVVEKITSPTPVQPSYWLYGLAGMGVISTVIAIVLFCREEMWRFNRGKNKILSTENSALKKNLVEKEAKISEYRGVIDNLGGFIFSLPGMKPPEVVFKIESRDINHVWVKIPNVAGPTRQDQIKKTLEGLKRRGLIPDLTLPEPTNVQMTKPNPKKKPALWRKGRQLLETAGIL